MEEFAGVFRGDVFLAELLRQAGVALAGLGGGDPALVGVRGVVDLFSRTALFGADGAVGDNAAIFPADRVRVVAFEDEGHFHVFLDLQGGVELLALFAAEALQRADEALLDQGADFVIAQGPAGHVFIHAHLALRILAAVELLGLLVAFRAAADAADGLEVGIDLVLHGLGEGAGFFHDLLRHLPDLAHEGGAVELALLHLAQLVFPLPGHFRRAEYVDADGADLLDEGQALRRHMHVPLHALDVAVHDQAFDDRGTRRRGAEAALAHGFGQFLVLHEFSGAFHDGKQGGFCVAGRRLGLQLVHFDVERVGRVAVIRGDEELGVLLFAFGGFFGGFLAVNSQPARRFEDLAVALEGVLAHACDAGCHLKLGGGEEDGHEAACDHVKELLLGFRQLLRRNQAGGDDGKVVADLAIVEDALVRTHPAAVQGGGGVRAQFMRQGVLLPAVVAGEGLQRGGDRGEIIFRQVPGVGSRIGQHLELLIERLGDLQRPPCGEAETVAGLPLQRGEVIQQRSCLTGGLDGLLDDPGLADAALGDGPCAGLVPDALGLLVLVSFVLLERLVDPAALILAGLHFKKRDGFEIGAGLEGGDFPLALGEDGKRGRLHAANRSEAETAVAGVQRCQGAGAVDADDPVTFTAAFGGVGQGLHLLVAAQFFEGLKDGALGHRLHPEALDRLLRLGGVNDVSEDELPLAPGVAGIDE